ncbi:N,N-dimethylformamidase beta subunit family domain-containing protein [Arvimicrobium flavum]|uniref:N,N-dimethylformamidase beta subunit family domain-containing protein n=1 Tax=Arvimicrobium flavum TaxID=3393320 RepID=UPI00237C4632|nr:N,N-dimethylformamidase beta subunit family domain-containing protein [Mesorhizobium shangrilense]
MYEIDPSRLDLAREFRAAPLGPHSAELTAVLTRMRGLPIDGKHCLIVAKPREKWLLAQISGAPPRPQVVPGHVFSSIEEAEWAVFKLRWHVLTGHDLATDLGEAAALASEAVPPPDTSRVILAYADTLTAGSGDTVGIKVSTPGIETYSADVVRLHAPARGVNDAGFRESEIESLGVFAGRTQPLRLGSFAKMPDALKLPASFSIQVFVWPTLYGNPGTLLGDWSESQASGVTLFLDAAGALTLKLGDGERVEEVTTGVALPLRTWSRVAASYDAATGAVRLVQEPLPGQGFVAARRAVAEGRISLAPTASGRAVLIAARHEDDAHGESHGCHFNGKVEAPAILGSALDAEGLSALPLLSAELAVRRDIVAAWDFSREIGTGRAVDVGPNRHDGRLLNQPARAMAGHLWDGAARDFTTAPSHYGAIHFHDDDIDDAGWRTDVSIRVADDWPSGVYACRLRGGAAEAYIPFFVRPAKKKAKVAFLAPTATYTVYANNRARFFLPTTELIRGRVLDFDVADLQLLDYPLGLSTYCVHSDGSGVAYGTRLRPVTNFRPKGRLWNFAEDLFVVEWLEMLGVDFDVITDDDLHVQGKALLEPYRVVLTGAHPEYYSTEMYDAVEGYLTDGGRLMYLGGNGFYWRIAYHPDNQGIIETRRAEDGTRAWDADPGEYYMGFSGEMSGLWRRQGRSPHRLVGIGFSGQGFDRSSYFRRANGSHDPRAAFIFDGIEGEILGDFGASGGAAGEELDSFDPRLGSPAHALVLASSENHSPAYQPANDMVMVPHLGTGALFNPAVKADMVFFECPNGGAVFSTGSIAYAGALSHNGFDNDIARLTGNVLRRFADPEPFDMPAG